MEKTLFTLLGLSLLFPSGSSAQTPAAAPVVGYRVQSSAARNETLREQELQAAVQKAREMKALRYATAAQPMAPIPWVPEPKPEPAPASPAPVQNYAPVPPAPTSSPNAAAVAEALRNSTNAPPVDLPSNEKSGNLFSKLLGKKQETPDVPMYESPTGSSTYQPSAPSPYQRPAVERSEEPAPAPPVVSAPPKDGASIFVKRGSSSSQGKSGSIKYEVDVDVSGVDVILPQGVRVEILEERDGFARVRIPDGRTGIVDRSAIQ